MFAATTAAGAIEAVQAIHLTPGGQNKRRLDSSKIKLTRGSLANHPAVRLPAIDRGLDAPLQHAEGPETGLSAWRATGLSTWIHLGPVSRARLPAGRANIILRDDDAPGSKADDALETALAGWRQGGVRVVAATPWPERRGDKSDFNDVLRTAVGREGEGKTEKPGLPPVPGSLRADALSARQAATANDGLAAVAARIKLAELALHGLAAAPPPFELPTATRDEVRGSVREVVAQFLRQRLDKPPPRIMVAGTPGVGKTHEICDAIPNIIAADKHMKRPHRVIYPVPMHRLGRQIIARFAERFRAAGITTAVYEGRGVSNSEQPLDDAPAADGCMPLCRNPLEVRLALNACADVTKAVCGISKKNGGPLCSYRGDCKYWSQLGECSKADVVFLAHNFIFEKITDHTEMVFANVGTIIVDEDPSAHGDGTVTLAMSDLGDGALAAFPVRDTRKGKKDKPNPNFGRPDHAKTEELSQHFAALQSALDQVGQGVPLCDALAAEGLTGALLKQARRLNWKRYIAAAMWPGMPLAEREEAARRASVNPVLVIMHALFCALMETTGETEEPDAAPDGLDDGDAEDFDDPVPGRADGASERVEVKGSKITVYRLRPAADWVEARPVLLASASARPELLAQHFPGLQHTPALMPAAPFEFVHQHLGAFGQDATEEKLPELLAKLKAIIAGRSALVVTYKRVAEATAEALPGVAVRYHGGTVGDDDFGNVEVVIVIGGAFPKAKDVRRLASAEAGRILPFIKPVRTSAVALLADGSADGIGVHLNRLAYADEAAQAVHAGIYDASIIQAIGRGRGLNRTAANPVETHVFANCPLPMPLASIDRWRRPSRLAKMLWAGCVPLSAAGMARRYPEEFPSAHAARQAKHRWGGEAALLDALRPEAERLPYATALVTLQPTGRKRTRLIVDRDRIEALHAEAVAEFGGLVSWHVESFSRGTEPRPAGKTTVTSRGKEGALSRQCHTPLRHSCRRHGRSVAWPRPAPRPTGKASNFKSGFLE